MLMAVALSACTTTTPRSVLSTVVPQPPQVQGTSIPNRNEEQTVETAYGQPAFVRKEPDSELWRYDGSQCQAFFFFDRVNGALVMRSVATLPDSKGKADEKCLKALRARVSPSS
jgi:hypothetical protein